MLKFLFYKDKEFIVTQRNYSNKIVKAEKKIEYTSRPSTAAKRNFFQIFEMKGKKLYYRE